MISLKQLKEAQERLSQHLTVTSLRYSEGLSQRLGTHVHLKMETEHETGSFKVRGAINKLSILKEEGVHKVVTASTGNHGAAVSLAGRLLGMEVVVYVPETINSSKLEKLNSYGVEVIKIGDDGIISEKQARSFSEESGIPYVSPYNDYDVIAGQGTMGLEIRNQMERVDRIYVSLGGGGLAGGLGSAFKAAGLDTKIVACSPSNSPVMMESISQGKIVDLELKPTLSDGTAGGMEEGAVTLELCKEVLDSYLALGEEQIRHATSLLNYSFDTKAEGAAGLALAGAFLDQEKMHKDMNVVIILCGENIDQATLDGLAV